MPSDVVLKAVEIEGFRGFRDRVRFEFGASAVLLAGPNGTGKTSFFDAVQWLLLGELERLTPFRARKNSEHIVNTYQLPEPAYVAGTFSSPSAELTAIRRGNWEASTLEVRLQERSVFGSEATDSLRSFLCEGVDVPMDVLLQNAGILQQDVMRHVLEAHPSDRHRFISALLGLSSLEGVQEAANATAKVLRQRAQKARAESDAASQESMQQQQRVQAVRDTTVEDVVIERARAELRELLNRAANNSAISVRKVDSLAELQADARAILGFLGQLQRSIPDLERLDSMPALTELQQSLAENERSRSALVAEMETHEASLRSASVALEEGESRAEDLERLASLALGMLGEACPVCEQKIDASHVATRLRERTSDASDLSALRTARADASQHIAQLRQAEAEQAKTGDRLSEDLRRRDALQGVSATLDVALDRLGRDPGSLRLNVESLRAARVTPWSDVQASLEAISDRIDNLQSLERAASDVATIDRLNAELSAAEADQQRLEVRAEDATRRADEIDRFAKAVADARTRVTQRRFEAIQPLVEDIFSRLDPHPTFKVLEFDHTMYRSKPTTSAVVRDSDADLDAEPLLVFSSSQANIVALSYFLAVGLAAVHRRLPFVMLDDPLQSMDDVNVLGFADLCRYIRRDRQIFVSTHDRRFASLLERKLTARGDGHQTDVVEFWGWDRSGPSFTQRVLESVPEEEIPFPLVRV